MEGWAKMIGGGGGGVQKSYNGMEPITDIPYPIQHSLHYFREKNLKTVSIVAAQSGESSWNCSKIYVVFLKDGLNNTIGARGEVYGKDHAGIVWKEGSGEVDWKGLKGNIRESWGWLIIKSCFINFLILRFNIENGSNVLCFRYLNTYQISNYL